MKTIFRTGLCAVLLAIAVCAQSPRSASVDVKFNFVAGDKEFPPGYYHFFQPSDAAGFVSIRSMAGNSAAQLRVHRLLARRGPASADSVRLVFDNVGGQHILSEVWLPGHDGLLVQSTQGNHTHEVVK